MASRFTRKWTCFVFNPTWAMKVLGFSDPDKYIEDEVGAPTLATHAVSFTGLFLVTAFILYMGGGFGCGACAFALLPAASDARATPPAVPQLYHELA